MRAKGHDVTMVPRLILLERQTQILGVRESSGDLERADRCARFVLEFDSVYDIDYAGGTGSAHHHVHATVPLLPIGGGLQVAAGPVSCVSDMKTIPAGRASVKAASVAGSGPALESVMT